MDPDTPTIPFPTNIKKTNNEYVIGTEFQNKKEITCCFKFK